VTSADIDPAAPGVIYARLREIPVTTDFMDVTGKPEVRIGLREHMLEPAAIFLPPGRYLGHDTAAIA